MRIWGSSHGPTQWVKDLVLLGGRCGSDLVLLWLGCRPAVPALIQSLTLELPYVTGMAVKRKKEKKKDCLFVSPPSAP